VATVSITADGVIALSAATVATSDLLDEDALALDRTIGQVDDLVPGAPSVRARVSTVLTGLADLAGWAHRLAVDYVDHERPLRELMTLGFWLPDVTALGWDTSQTVGENTDSIVRSDEFVAGPLGVGADLLNRYRHWELALPKPGSGAVVSTIVRASQGLLPEQQLPGAVFGGRTYVPTGSGLLVDSQGSASPALAAGRQAIDDAVSSRTFTTAGTSGLAWDTSLGHPPVWASTAGKGLAVVGVGLTLYDAGATQWEHDATYHPEWSTGERVASTAATTVVVGGAAAAGGWAGAVTGAEVGASWGAALGSVVPGLGTAAGAVVGGIVGGVAGGFIGSEAGRAGGTLLKEAGTAMWNGLFG
jgi:hypothetical protein